MAFGRSVVAALVILTFGSSLAGAQPTLSSSSVVVTPGAAVTLTVTGTAGQQFAIIGSTVGSGFSYGGTALGVGPDVVIIAQGVIGGTGNVAVGFAPPFLGSTLDRYYVQAVTSASPAFVPLEASTGLILKNADAADEAVMGSNPASVGSFTLAAGSNYLITTAPFVAATDMACLVTSSLQIDPVVAVPIGNTFGYVRNAVSRNGVDSQDGVHGQYLPSNGLITYQPSMSRSSVMQVGAGETVRFGVFLGSAPAGAAGASARVQTSYLCR